MGRGGGKAPSRARRWLRRGIAAAALFGAASLLAAYGYGRFAEGAQGVASHALPHDGPPTVLDRWIAPRTAAHAGESGLVLQSSNLDAFAARALSARAAGRSLDLMYYIWKDDLTGDLLLAEAVSAADRGVRVRILLDDIGVHGFDDTFLALASHPRIELRLFNPTRARENTLRRGIEMALRAFSVNRRMHNKAWIADGRVAVIGGRNIGDEYFDAAETSNFRDLDLLAIGPVVAEAERIFDAYWNSGFALPIGALASAEASTGELRARLAGAAQSAAAAPYVDRLRARASEWDLLRDGALYWTDTARLLSDPPDKVLGGEYGENWLMRELMPHMEAARESLEITSPYFVPGEAGTASLAALAARGVAVSVLTNSLAATDVAMVHGGYAPYRKRLLEGGVALFELRPTASPGGISLQGSSNASLHSKAFAVDGMIGFIGSLNFDPRSSSLNTEMGILFEKPELVAAMRAIFAEEVSPALSYTVRLDAAGALRWHAEEDGRPVTYDREPKASLARRAVARAASFLPIESQL